jgi:stringent starvation protein B
MNSNRPYLIRAIYEWIVDNDLTPYMLIDANCEGVQVPFDYVEDGKIVLNISPDACRGLHLDNDRIIFTAKFSGNAVQVFLPPMAVVALYAKENGKGMFFKSESEHIPMSATKTKNIDTHNQVGKSITRSSKARLTLVKNNC